MVEFVCFIIAMISFLAIIMHSVFQIAVFNVKSKSQLSNTFAVFIYFVLLFFCVFSFNIFF
jgi:hypothetical protein